MEIAGTPALKGGSQAPSAEAIKSPHTSSFPMNSRKLPRRMLRVLRAKALVAQARPSFPFMLELVV